MSNFNVKTFLESNSALSSFINDFEFLQDLNDLKQKDIAQKVGTTQSAISRITSLRANPSYKILNKLSEAVGGKLYITPLADMTITIPFDLQQKVNDIAKEKGLSVKDYLFDAIRKSIDDDYNQIADVVSN